MIHLPPTMSPAATSKRDRILEHPDEAFEYYRSEGVSELVIQEKHMGSRALIAICRDEDTAREGFGVTSDETGMIYTRTGRPFFGDADTLVAVLARLRAAMTAAGFWERNCTGWALLDAEIMPWSAKAQALIRMQYAATAAAAKTGLSQAVALLEMTIEREAGAAPLLARFSKRAARAERYAEAYRRYCWAVSGTGDYRIAPFHLLATEGALHMDKDHLWHMAELSRLAASGDEMVMATAHHLVSLEESGEGAAAVEWWTGLTRRAGKAWW